MSEPAAATRLHTDKASEPTEVAVLPQHLIAFKGEPWAFWRWCGLRGAGFPAHLVLTLAAPACAAAVDEILAAEKRAVDCRTETIAVFRQALDRTEDQETRKSLSRALSHLNKGRVPSIAGDLFAEPCRSLASAYAQVDAANKTFKEEFAAGVLRTSKAVRHVADDPNFRRAVLIQNGAALRRVLHAFSGTPIEKRGFKERQNEEMVANYLQRYCVKNDTIGFFGPVGWARLGRKVSDIAVSAGPNLVATSSICFENWCIEALAEKIAENPAVRRWIPPRRSPEFHLDGSTLRSAAASPTALSSQQLAVLQLCDGERTAAQIASSLVGSDGFLGEDEVYDLLAELTKKNVLSWAYDLPLVLHPEQRFRQLLNRIDDEALRGPALAQLDRLEQARNNVAAAVDDAGRLSVAIRELEQAFEEVTGGSGSRLGGKMYASRTLFYQDCRRDVEVDVGPAVLEAITPPLSLVLTSARWLSHRVAGVSREAFIKAHAMMAPRSGASVELMRFWKYLQLLLFSRKPETNILTPVIQDLQDRWKRVLDPLAQSGRGEYTSAQLKPRVDDLFAAPEPGWPTARHHSPDVMIGAASIDAIRRGECYFVMGEVHVCANTLNGSLFVAQHPRPDDCYQSMTGDFTKPRVVFMFPRTWPRTTNRTADVLHSPDDYHVELSHDSLYADQGLKVLPVAEFVVKNLGGRVVVCTRDGRLQFDAVEFFGELLTRAALGACDFMKVLNFAAHNPRITIDRLVVSRESWQFSARSLTFIHEEDEHLRYLRARRWMHEHSLPRFVFFKVPVEVKPFYVDFESPIYVEILVKVIRRMLASDEAEQPVLLSEMLPGHGELWLPDAEGNVYASELRFVVKDLMV